MPRVDLCAAGLYQSWRALLSQGQDHAAAAQAVLHFGCRALAAHDSEKLAPVFGKDHAPQKLHSVHRREKARQTKARRPILN